MLSSPDNELVTLVSNNLFVLAEAWAAVFVVYWLWKTTDHADRTVMIAWLLVSVGYMWRIGYWSLALAWPDEVYTRLSCTLDLLVCEPLRVIYPEWSTTWRWTLIFPAMMVLSGNVMFIAKMRGHGLWKQVAAALAIVSLAQFLALA